MTPLSTRPPEEAWPPRLSWLRRVAAVVAPVAPVAIAVVAAVALAGDVGITVLAVGLMLVANAAVRFALTERGARRALGAVAAALAGAGLIVVTRSAIAVEPTRSVIRTATISGALALMRS